MSQTINLLPIDLVRGKEVGKLLSVLKASSIFLCALVLVVAIAGFAFVYLQKNDLTQVQTRRDTVRSEVLALEESEKQLVLLRDRLAKIEKIRSEDTSTPLFEAQKIILDNAPVEVTLGESDINAGTSSLTLVSQSIDPLRTLIANLESSSYDRPLSISTFTLNALVGYKLVLLVN